MVRSVAVLDAEQRLSVFNLKKNDLIFQVPPTTYLPACLSASRPGW